MAHTQTNIYTENCWALLHSIHSHGIFWEYELENIKDVFVLHQIDGAEVGHKTLPLRGGEKEKRH